MMIIDKIHKALILLKIFLKECFGKCQVVKMSAYFNRDGSFSKENWGDDINYWFLQEISDNKIISWDWSILCMKFHRPYVAGIGSILTLFNMDNAIVWGSGTLSVTDKINGIPKEIRAVRGPLTRQWLLNQGIDCPVIYGDPALLLPKYYQPEVKKKYKLGVVAHYVDQENPLLQALRDDNEVLMIDIRRYAHWLDFIDQICQCEVIVSSSLHGLIISEAYGIPNLWIKLKGSELSDDIKYHDFFLSIGIDREPYNINEVVSSQSLLSVAKEWHKGLIDLQPLIQVCPLNLKENFIIHR